MPSSTYVGIANITLGSSAASVTFSSISQAYRDLILVSTATTSSDDYFSLTFNNDTGANYTRVLMKGNGSSATSSSGTSFYVADTSSGVSQLVTQIMDFSATDKHKTYLNRLSMSNGSANDGTTASAFRWANTSAITSLKLTSTLGNFLTGSTFALYGVAA